MPIPPFDGIRNILPPHLGDPRQPTDLSPYACTIAELRERFAATPRRKAILRGFLDLRAQLLVLEIQGFQWLGGSFLEDIETQEGRDPNDLDAITFVTEPASPLELGKKLESKPELLSRARVKTTYSIDHFWVPLGSKPVDLIDQTRYWYGLFSHRRDGVWKGMLVVDLTDKSADDAARGLLEDKS